MTWGDGIILVVIFLWLLFSLNFMRRRRKKGKCIGCGGDCSTCRERHF